VGVPMYEVISINVGKPATFTLQDKEIATGIFKQPVDQPLFLSTTNFEGDGQADLVHHGGVDKAVCVYPADYYPYWTELLKRPLACGAFGENVTVKGLREETVCIGDVFQLGEAVVQVSQPRQPCYKLARRYDVTDLPLQFQHTGYTGFYFRVLREGYVPPRTTLTLLDRHSAGVTIAYANRIMHHDKEDRAGIERILQVAELSANWQKTFRKRLEGTDTDSKVRLIGDK
jgi:MOSC domain-containing protein YiiM